MAPERPHRRLSADTVIAVIVLVLAVVFVFENTARISVRFIGPRIRVQIWVALLVALVAGVVIGWLMRRWRDRSH